MRKATIDEIPFDFNRRRLSIVVKHAGDTSLERLLITKGGPEGILALCISYDAAGKKQEFNAEALALCNKTYQDFCKQGLRVLAVAYRQVLQHDGFSIEDEHSLTLAGFLVFADPPTPDAGTSLAALHRDGVQVKILTGDNELVARHICAEVGWKIQ